MPVPNRPGRLIYAPEGADPREWRINLADIESDEAEMLEDELDMTFVEFVFALARGSMKAERALLWLLLRRDNPELSRLAVSIKPNDLRFEVEERDADEEKAVPKAEPSDSPTSDND